MTETIQVALGERSYPIHIGAGLLDDAKFLREQIDSQQLLIVTNTTIAPLYLQRVQDAFQGRQVTVHTLPDGEQEKSLQQFEKLIDVLVEGRFHRDATAVALGGGVIGDLTGFAAAAYQRGIKFVQLPTTLLAQVDSSVGGKTGVNHPAAKNMVGAFHQPEVVVIDIQTLNTLADRELRAGLAEVIKYGLIMDAGFFQWLEGNIDALLARDSEALAHAIAVSCQSKAQIVAADEREAGQRALLNLGHTFGHAIEALAGYGQVLHGEAVAIGMLLAAETSVALGMLAADQLEPIFKLIERAGLPTELPALPPAQIIETMALDKKVKQGQLRLVLLDAIGSARLVDSPGSEQLLAVLEDHSDG
ncbi:MAG: 3-dehydroquinate synthase [Gammaproteobacteria bacterium]